MEGAGAVNFEQPPFQPTHQHRKSGKFYRLLRYGHHEADQAPVAVYVDIAGDVHVRDRAEFDDPSRFEPIAVTRQPPTTTVYAWVVEAGFSKIDRPMYFAGVDGLGRYRWSYDHSSAVRFHRRQDAESMLTGDILGTNHRACEHAWDYQSQSAAVASVPCGDPGADAA